MAITDPTINDIRQQTEKAQVGQFTDPNGNNFGVVKGEDLLEHMIKTGRSRSVQLCTIPFDGADTAEFITALYQLAGRRAH